MKPMKRINRQGGFTLTELAIAAVIIAILTVAAAQGYGMYRTNTNISVASNFFVTDVPGAVAVYLNRRGTLTGINKISLTSYGLAARTAWDDDWTVTGPTAGALTFTYPLTSAGTQGTEAATDIVARLTNADLQHIESATATGTSVTVVVRAQ